MATLNCESFGRLGSFVGSGRSQVALYSYWALLQLVFFQADLETTGALSHDPELDDFELASQNRLLDIGASSGLQWGPIAFHNAPGGPRGLPIRSKF